MSPKVGVRPPLASHRHHERLPRLRPVEGVSQDRPEPGDDRHEPGGVLPAVVSRFLAPHRQPAVLPIHVGPRQDSHLGRTPEPGQPGESEHEPPLNARGSLQNGVDHLQAYVAGSSDVHLGAGPEIGKGILLQPSPPHRRGKELLGDVNALGD
ncbi:MAG: hypothetical protein WCJ31_18000 [Planctomycetia bacterium]